MLTEGSSFLCHPPFAVCHAVSPILGTRRVGVRARASCRTAAVSSPPRTARCSQCAQARWSSSTAGSGGTGVSGARNRTALPRWRYASRPRLARLEQSRMPFFKQYAAKSKISFRQTFSASVPTKVVKPYVVSRTEIARRDSKKSSRPTCDHMQGIRSTLHGSSQTSALSRHCQRIRMRKLKVNLRIVDSFARVGQRSSLVTRYRRARK